MGNYNFLKDLAGAKLTEMEVASLVCLALPNYALDNVTTTFSDKEKGWDFKVTSNTTGTETYYEVKEDFYCARSGNVAIEVESRGKPSGITTTTASFWIIKAHLRDDVTYYMIEPPFILNEIERYNKGSKDTVILDCRNGGDKGTSAMYLIPHERLLEIGGSVIQGHKVRSTLDDYLDTHPILVVETNLSTEPCIGLQGRVYHIPTMDTELKPLPLDVVSRYVDNFKKVASMNLEVDFKVTPFTQGFKPYEIAPMFKGAGVNVVLPKEYRTYV